MDDDDVFVDPVSADLSFEKMIHSNRQYIYNSLLKAALGHYVMNATDIGHSDPSQNYEKMGTEFILLLLHPGTLVNENEQTTSVIISKW
jgi:hypothetical protein